MGECYKPFSSDFDENWGGQTVVSEEVSPTVEVVNTPGEIVADGILTADFLKRYEGTQPENKGSMFEVIYCRTYCRWDVEKKRRETWTETCKRVAEYSVSLDTKSSEEWKRQEAELLFENMFNLKCTSSGRTMWVGGTKAAELNPESNYNCAFLIFNRLSCLREIMHLTFGGTGVGFRIQKEDVAQLPNLNPHFTIEMDDYHPNQPGNRLQETKVIAGGSDPSLVTIVVGDTREGWLDAVSTFLDCLTDPLFAQGVKFRFNFDNVRPAGERLKTFGGFAAGPKPLQETFKAWDWIIKECDGKLRPIVVLDLACSMAEHMAAGGTRSAALIALFSEDDLEMAHAKNGDALGTYEVVLGEKGEPELNDKGKPKKKWVASRTAHRTKSNNSAVFEKKPSFEKITSMLQSILDRGEPGWINMEAGRKRRADFQGVNPCGEILLDDRGFCNLSTVIFTSFIRDGVLDRQKLEESIRLSARVCTRMTCVDISLPEWDKVQKRDRLNGVDVTGWMDGFDMLGIHALSDEARQLRMEMNGWANDEADKYAEILGIPRPLLVTTVKPNGTLSLLPTVSSGMHRSWSHFYIKRVSVMKSDPLCAALDELGVPSEEDTTKRNSPKKKFLFPIKSASKVVAQQEPFRDQFMRYLDFQETWTDHNSSNTLYFSPEELEEAAKLIDEHWDNIVAISMLRKESIPSPYPQPPLEMITEEEYNALKSKSPNLEKLPEMVNKYEFIDAGFDDNSDCAGGVCPVR